MSSLKSKIESLLFISAKPMSTKQLADLTKKKADEVARAGDELVEDYKGSKNGIQIIKNKTKYQMVSSPENAKLVQEFIKDETTGELTRPSLEALTIIAYRGPVSKIDLDRIRGVNCALILRNLLLRGLIEARNDKQKGETYYTVTFDFIRFLGINDVAELPEYERLNKDDTIDRMLAGEKEAGEAAKDNDSTESDESKQGEADKKQETKENDANSEEGGRSDEDHEEATEDEENEDYGGGSEDEGGHRSKGSGEDNKEVNDI